jgi:ADP-ribosylglycohydrolase
MTGRASGCLFGVAFGDSLGAATEFLSVEEIVRQFPPRGPETLQGNPARVTDDTQMTLAVGEALVSARAFTSAALEPALRKAFVAWLVSPDNDRAPGLTCMKACRALRLDIPWRDATVGESKGCGANMRAAPVGLLPSGHRGIAEAERASIAQFQAALTHGHPTALTASDLTAKSVAFLAGDGAPGALVRFLRDYARSQRRIYHREWLGDIWRRAGDPDLGDTCPQDYVSRGWDECLRILDRLDSALQSMDRELDPCLQTGAGWTAEEALATGLLCFLMYPEEPVAAIQRAAASSGDSDSIACLTGAFAGAHCGIDAWPADWPGRIEYRDRLAALSAVWDGPG